MQFDMFGSGQMGSEFYGFIYDLFEGLFDFILFLLIEILELSWD